MKKRLKNVLPILSLLMFAAGLASCSTDMSCLKVIVGDDHRLLCHGFEDELDHKRLIRVDLQDVAAGSSIGAELGVLVAVGDVNVTYQNGNGGFITLQVSPKKPLRSQTMMRLVSADQVEITIEATGGVASGVEWSANFTR